MNRSINLPAKVVVSLRAGAVLALANIICVVILAWAYTAAKAEPKVISVTGSARQTIESDLIVWQASISVNDADLQRGYEQLAIATEKTLAFLKARGISNEELELSAIRTSKHYARDPDGNTTDRISSYDLVQTVQVSSTT